jgi:glycolate dehydrogenase FAD-linked subunit
MKVAPEKIHQLEEELVGVVGTEWVSRKDNSLVVQPRTVEEVAAILRKANREGVRVRPKGGGTGWWSSTQPPEGGVLLHMIRMNEVISVNEDVMTVTAGWARTFCPFWSGISTLSIKNL